MEDFHTKKSKQNYFGGRNSCLKFHDSNSTKTSRRLTTLLNIYLFSYINTYKYLIFLFIEWSREVLLEKWMKDPVECCQLAGVQAPSSVLQHGSSLDSNTSPDVSEETACPELTVSLVLLPHKAES